MIHYFLVESKRNFDCVMVAILCRVNRTLEIDIDPVIHFAIRTTKKLSDLVNIMKIVHEDDLEAELSREVLERCFLPESDCDERQKYRLV